MTRASTTTAKTERTETKATKATRATRATKATGDGSAIRAPRARSASWAGVLVLLGTVAATMAPACAAGEGAKPAESPAASAEASRANDSGGKPLDCGFVLNPANCWREFAAKVGACMDGIPKGQGVLDGATCTYEGDRTITFGSPCDPDGKCEVRQLKVMVKDKKCLEFNLVVDTPPTDTSRGAGSWQAIGPSGSVRMRWDETKKRFTCADGTVYTGSGEWKGELSDCAGENPAEGFPSYSLTVTPSNVDAKFKKTPPVVAFDMSSMDPLFECTPAPPAGAKKKKK